MRRREFITSLGGAATWPLMARAQRLAKPEIGFLSSLAQGETQHLLAAFLRGLKETGFQDGQNASLEYRFAEGDYKRLPSMAAELVSRGTGIIVAQAPPAALAAKAATATIPIVFVVGLDPVAAGLAAS